MRGTDDFERVNATGLGNFADTNLPYQIVGGARIVGGRAVFNTDRAQRPVAVVNTGLPTASLTIQGAAGADAVYARWVDSNNWGVGVRIRHYTAQTTYSYTEYRWIADFGWGVGDLTPRGTFQNPVTSRHDHPDISEAWTSSTTASPFPASYTHTHLIYDEVGVPFTMSHSHPRVGLGNPTGATRLATGTTSVGRYQIIAEQCVNGVVSVLGTATISGTGYLRAQIRGTTLEVWNTATGNPLFTAVAPAHVTATRHGFGLGPSEIVMTKIDAFTLDTLNDAPNAPGRVLPTDGSTINRLAATTFSFEHRDPNGGSMSGYDIQFRSNQSAAWDDIIHRDNSFAQYTADAGTFAEGQWLWRVRTYDQDGVVGPWSSDGFFTAAEPVSTHAILSPVNGAVIPTSNYMIEWSTPAQAAYRIRTLVGGTVTYDTGRVAEPSARAALVPFPTNNVTPTIQLAIEHNGLWGPYTTSTNVVSWLGPIAPETRLHLNDPRGAITIEAYDPEPFGDHPSVIDHILEREEAVVLEGTPVFLGNWEQVTLRPEQFFPANGTYPDWEVGSANKYRYRLTSIGSNGTTTPGEPVSEQYIAPGTYAFDEEHFDPAAFDIGLADD